MLHSSILLLLLRHHHPANCAKSKCSEAPTVAKSGVVHTWLDVSGGHGLIRICCWPCCDCASCLLIVIINLQHSQGCAGRAAHSLTGVPAVHASLACSTVPWQCVSCTCSCTWQCATMLTQQFETQTTMKPPSPHTQYVCRDIEY
jgi:hypothetical protein